MTTIAVRYLYDQTADERRAQYREIHRDFLRTLLSEGIVLASGAVSEPKGALIILAADSPQAALDILTDDPFLTAGGIIVERSAQVWDVAIGAVG